MYNNIEELRDMLLRNISKLEQDKIGMNKAKEMANYAGKVMNSCKVQMEYNTMKGHKDRVIAFMEVENK